MRPTAPAQGKCWWGPWLSMRPRSPRIKVLSRAVRFTIRFPPKHGDSRAHTDGPHKLHPCCCGQRPPGLLRVPPSFLPTPSENPPSAQGDGACGTRCLRCRAHLQAGEAKTGAGKPPQLRGAAAADPGGRAGHSILPTPVHVHACVHACANPWVHELGVWKGCFLVHFPLGASLSRMKKRRGLNKH